MDWIGAPAICLSECTFEVSIKLQNSSNSSFAGVRRQRAVFVLLCSVLVRDYGTFNRNERNEHEAS